jgi:hypothetical protein
MAPKGNTKQGGGRGNGGRAVAKQQGKKTVTKSKRGAAKQAVSKTRSAKDAQASGNRNRSRSSRAGRGGRNPRGSRSRAPKNNKREEKKPVTAEELDSAMDDYWLKSENKQVAAKKLDEEMDAYWEKKNQDKDDNVPNEDQVEKPDASTGEAS